MCSLGAVEDEDHMLLVCPAHHDICCKFGQQLGKQLTSCNLLTELMCSANQKAITFVLSFLPRQQECFAQINYVIIVKWMSLGRILTLN
jgi:hypothetical protein